MLFSQKYCNCNRLGQLIGVCINKSGCTNRERRERKTHSVRLRRRVRVAALKRTKKKNSSWPRHFSVSRRGRQTHTSLAYIVCALSKCACDLCVRYSVCVVRFRFSDWNKYLTEGYFIPFFFTWFDSEQRPVVDARNPHHLCPLSLHHHEKPLCTNSNYKKGKNVVWRKTLSRVRFFFGVTRFLSLSLSRFLSRFTRLETERFRLLDSRAELQSIKTNWKIIKWKCVHTSETKRRKEKEYLSS